MHWIGRPHPLTHCTHSALRTVIVNLILIWRCLGQFAKFSGYTVQCTPVFDKNASNFGSKCFEEACKQTCRGRDVPRNFWRRFWETQRASMRQNFTTMPTNYWNLYTSVEAQYKNQRAHLSNSTEYWLDMNQVQPTIGSYIHTLCVYAVSDVYSNIYSPHICTLSV